jgi:hypothetical protein
MTPRIDTITGSTLYTSGVVAALDMGDPTQTLFSMIDGSSFDVSIGTAVGPTLYDSVRHRLVMGGCFQRFASSGAGEPGTGRCGGAGRNLIRFLDVDARDSALAEFFDIFGDVSSVETVAIAFADFDPATNAPTTLWATLRNPDSLVKIAMPLDPSVGLRVQQISPMPISPADLVRIPRAGQSDLLAIVAEKANAIVLYDTGTQEVVGQVENLGDTPFSLALVGNDGTSARLAVTVFKGCKLALIEVPLAAPWQAQLRGRAGVCSP